MRHLRKNCGKPEIDFFNHPDFANFRASLDAEMKRLQSAAGSMLYSYEAPHSRVLTQSPNMSQTLMYA